MQLRILKRSGSIEKFDPEKIKRALLLAFNSVGEVPNVAPLVSRAMEKLREVVSDGTLDVEQIQDSVEYALMDSGHHNVAKKFILYRDERSRLRARRLSPDKNALPSYIHISKYARYQEDLQRRELYSETVDRVRDMHVDKLRLYGLGELVDRVDEAFQAVQRKELLPSMRSMQFAGNALIFDNARMYNCSYTLVDRWRVFQEIFYLLLCGCGVGYSVQWQHVEKLSPLIHVDPKKVEHYTIADDIKGWADAIGALIEAHTVTGSWIEFNYSQIRPEGAPLKTSGGKAPGHLPLRKCLEAVRTVLTNAAGRALRPIEASDMICHEALAVLAGGIRRSSLIGIFSSHDTEMIYAKARGNFRPAFSGDSGLNDHRQMVNLSAALLRGSTHKSVFDRLIRVAQENFGDPGFIFLNNLDHGTNPCGEIGLNPVFEGSTGFSFCNLCEINMATVENEEDYLKRVENATIIGTLQAAYTNFDYLGPVTEAICKREALLGIGMAGIQNKRDLALDPAVLRKGAVLAVGTNRKWAELLGINQAARVTTVKPGGTAPLELGVIGSGIHPMWSRRYFQRVTANPNEPCAQEFRRVNPHMVDIKPNGDWSLIFPIEVSGNVKTVKDTSAADFMEDVFTVYDNWVKPGTALPSSSPGLTHNVSCSVTVREGELDMVCETVWARRESVAAMSFIPYSLDQRFAYAPRQAVETAEDETRWARLLANYRPVDWSKFIENSDNTAHRLAPACADGMCEVKL